MTGLFFWLIWIGGICANIEKGKTAKDVFKSALWPFFFGEKLARWMWRDYE